jgi:hypothetical protein
MAIELWNCNQGTLIPSNLSVADALTVKRQLSDAGLLSTVIPVWNKFDVLLARPMSSWTEQEIMEYSFMTGQGWTL